MMHMLCKVRSENGYGFLRPGLKMGVENGIFWSEIGSGFGDAHPHQKFQGVPPRVKGMTVPVIIPFNGVKNLMMVMDFGLREECQYF